MILLKCRKWMGLLFIALLASTAQALDFTYTTDGGEATITGYTGPGGAVVISDTIERLPVTSIGDQACDGATNITSVVIPAGI